MFLADVLYPTPGAEAENARAQKGGALLGASLGVAAGLTLSKFFSPEGGDLLQAAGVSVAGGLLGRGLATLAVAHPSDNRSDSAGTLAGSLTGLAAGTLVDHYVPLHDADYLALSLGLGFAGLAGSVAPSLGDANWQGWHRANDGGLEVGVSAGALAAAALAHASNASKGAVTVAGLGALDGLVAGLGLGAMLEGSGSSRGERVGMVAGPLVGAVGLGLLDQKLHLHDGLNDSAAPLGLLGGLVGAINGAFLGDILYPSGQPGTDYNKARAGGAVFGATLGITSGLLLSKRLDLDSAALATASGASLAGALMGRGLVMLALADPTTSRADSAGTMAGGLAGLGAGALVARYAPLTAGDAVALPFGAGLGGLVGALAPTLGETAWPGWQRDTQGGLLLGVGAGSVAALALSHAVAATPATATASGLGSLDGALTGLGIGMLLDGASESRGQRIGMVAGLGAGLGLGVGLWARADFHEGTLPFLSAAIAIGGFNGALVPRLGHANGNDVTLKSSAGGILAGAGAGSLLAASLATRLDVDPDLTLNALTLDGIFTGAGAGIGILASQRDDAPVMGMLAAGGAGLLLGGALHKQIHLNEEDVPFLTFAGAEGLWFGGFLPYILRPSTEVQDRQIAAGLAAGGLGATG
ncbi:MAG TPA: hypothetical protein VF518_15910, partial [Polyangia bacterium]